MIRAVGYVRVSTDDQKKNGDGLRSQQAMIVAHCATAGYSLDEAHLFADEGISGKSLRHRDGFSAAMDAACAEPSVLIVYSVSRMARSVKDSYAILDKLTRAGSRLVSLTESFDLKTPSGRFMFGILVLHGVYELEITTERTESVRRHKKSSGERIGNLPVGSKVIDDGRRSKKDRPIAVVADQVELEAIERIRELAAEGLGPRPIARVMRGEGRIARSGRAWASSTIQGVLKRLAKS